MTAVLDVILLPYILFLQLTISSYIQLKWLNLPRKGAFFWIVVLDSLKYKLTVSSMQANPETSRNPAKISWAWLQDRALTLWWWLDIRILSTRLDECMTVILWVIWTRKAVMICNSCFLVMILNKKNDKWEDSRTFELLSVRFHFCVLGTFAVFVSELS